MRQSSVYRKILTLILLSSVLFFLSCEFDNSDNNFHDITPPLESVPIGIDLAGMKVGDPIYIYTETRLYFTIGTSGRELLMKEYYFDNKLVLTEDGSETQGINIDPGTIYADEDHTFSMRIYLKTGTGSLAEMIGLEAYMGEITFNMKYVKADMKLNVKQRQNKDKHLELYWDKPELEQVKVKGYTIYDGDGEFNGKQLAYIEDPNQTSFVDPDYAYGYKSYHVRVDFEGDKIKPWNEYITAEYKPIEELHTSRISPNKVKIEFNNENTYPCKYVVRFYDDATGAWHHIPDGQTYLEKEGEAFPLTHSQKSIILYIVPKDATENDYDNYTYVFLSYSDPYIAGSSTSQGTDKFSNNFYTWTYDQLNIYDINTMRLKKTPTHGIDTDSRSKVSVNKGGLIAFSGAYSKVRIYKDDNLTTLLRTFETTGDYMLTDNNKFIYCDYAGIYMADVNTGNKTTLKSLAWIEGFVASKCGKYIIMSINEDHDMGIFDISTGTPSKISDIDNNEVVYFDNDRLIVNKGNDGTEEFITYQLPTMTVLKKMQGTFKDIDPYTGNIAYVDRNYSENKTLYLLAPDYSKTLFSMRLDSDFHSLILTNNFLFVNNNYINLANMIQP